MADSSPTNTVGVLHNKHDVQRIQETCSTLNTTLTERFNIHVDPHAVSLDGLRGQAEARALCKLLVKKGIVTDDEVNYEVLSFCADVLAALLQRAEEEMLTAKHKSTGVQAVRQPLIVAKH